MQIAVFHFLALNRCKIEVSVTPFVSYQLQFFIVMKFKLKSINQYIDILNILAAQPYEPYTQTVLL